MLCPTELIFVRHGESEYNALKKRRERDPLYQRFRESYTRDWQSIETQGLAIGVKRKFFLGVSQHYTPITSAGRKQGTAIAKNLKKEIALPDAIFISPSPRTKDTFLAMKEGWPELSGVPAYLDERIREQEHGLVTLYNDLRAFFALNWEQRELYDVAGEYFFKFPNGENVPDVNLRFGLWLKMLREKFYGRRVLAVTHHRLILAARVLLEDLPPEEFVRLDEKEKPVNCGVTIYRKEPAHGKFGKLVLVCYNKKLESR